jgi:photosystem II stability/assembly factor-like uncharacterized protein
MFRQLARVTAAPVVIAILGGAIAAPALSPGSAFVGIVAAAPSLVSGWKPQSVPPLNGRPPILYRIDAFDPSTLWAVGSQGPANVALFAEILKTTDGGKTWRVQYSPQEGSEMRDVVAQSALRVTALQSRPGGATSLVASEDGGQTWSDVYRTPSSAVQLWALGATQVGYTWAVGTNGTIRVSFSGSDFSYDASYPTTATLWATTAAPAPRGQYYWESGRVGWAVGDAGTVLKTTDAGFSWRLQAQISGERLIGVGAASESVAWAVGTNGAIFKTVNGGETWFRQYAENTVSYNAIAVGSETTAWLLSSAEGGVIGITATTDGGASWVTQYQDSAIPADRLLGGITAVSPSEAWAAAGPTILHTSTAGFVTLRSLLPLAPRSAGSS